MMWKILKRAGWTDENGSHGFWKNIFDTTYFVVLKLFIDG